VNNEQEGAESIRSVLEGRGIPVLNVQRIVPSLEDVFLYLLERDTVKAA